jgi:hypothetical protein
MWEDRVRKANSFLDVALLCAMLVACGDESNEEQAGKGDPPTADGKESAWAPGAADPCDINTGYPGDDMCIKPPPPEMGFQLHYGPKDYNDPEEVKKYLLMPGEEVTDCVFMKTPNDREVFHAEYHGRMRPGSHHLLVYTQPGDMADSEGPSDCESTGDQRNIVGSQTPTIDIYPGSSGAPEDRGLAQRLPPRQQAMFQLHYINTGTEPILREGWVNLIYTDEKDVKQEADPIFFLAGLGSTAPAGETSIWKGQAVAEDDVRLIGASGHFHANTVRFSAWKVQGDTRDLILEDYDWHDPVLLRYNTVTKNPEPNPKTKTAGGWSGLVELKKGDRIEWECEIVNDTTKPLKFGNAVY